MFGKKKKLMIDKIEKMMVSSKTYSNEHVFSMHLDRSFSEIAKDGLKPILQDFILASNERFCSGCYWLVSAYDFDEFWQYDQYEPREMAKYLIRNNPSISYIWIDAFDIFLLLNKLSTKTFSMLNNATLPNGEMLLLDVFDAQITAFYPEFSDSIENRFSDMDIGIIEAADIFAKQKKEIDVWYFDSAGAKRHEITISCTPERRNDFKDCLLEVFNEHGIQLEFMV